MANVSTTELDVPSAGERPDFDEFGWDARKDDISRIPLSDNVQEADVTTAPVPTAPVSRTREEDLEKGPPFAYEDNWDPWNERLARSGVLKVGDDSLTPGPEGVAVEPKARSQIEILPTAPSKTIEIPDAANLSIRVTPLPDSKYRYEAILDKGAKVIDISDGGWMITPERFEAGLGKPYFIKLIRRKIEESGGIVYNEERESWFQTISSGMQQGVAFIPGLPAWIGNSLLSIPDIFVSLGDWAIKGFPENHPAAKGRFDQYLSQPKGEYLGSPEQFERLAQNVGDSAGMARRFINEATGTVTIPMINQEIGLGNFLNMLEFDTTAQTRDKAQLYLSLLGNIIGAAPVEGALIGKLIHKMSTVKGAPTEDKLVNEMTSYEYSTTGEGGFWSPRTWASTRAEMGMGFVATTGMVGAMELGEGAPHSFRWRFHCPPRSSHLRKINDKPRGTNSVSQHAVGPVTGSLRSNTSVRYAESSSQSFGEYRGGQD